MRLAPTRPLASALFALGGAVVALFITGKLDVAALSSLALGAGLGLLVGRPVVWPGWLPLLLALLFLVSVALSLVPVAADALPSWRGEAPQSVGLSDSFAAVPAYVFFWWLVLAGTIATGIFISASPLDVASLRVFLHVAAGSVCVYAVVSIVQAQTAWTYPLSGGANFGLLPNRNHTATLLAVGSIVSFGLMQWEVSHSHRVGSVLAAVWGAPSLAALLFFSTSRAGVLVLMAGFLLWVVGAAGRAVSRRTTLGAVGILAGFLALLFVLGGSVVRDRLEVLWSEVVATEAGHGEARELDFRQPVFRDTFSMIADVPLTGQGLGHFEFVFPHYRNASLRAVGVLHPESDWLMVAAESGVPSLGILVILVAWYFVRSWRGRRESGGLLRWTVASGIGAALLHGIIDVPWHRPALGWFLLIVGLAALPSTAMDLRWPRLWRALQLLTGVAMVSSGVYLAVIGSTDRPPLGYRWDFYNRELATLGAERRHEEGEALANEAVRDFPLHSHAYYWRAAFLRTFEQTDAEIKADIAAGRFAEPVLPSTAAEQAQIWVDINPDEEADARAEAIRRARLIEQGGGGGASAVAELEKALRAAQGRPAVQEALRRQFEADPILLAQWACFANPDLADAFLAGIEGEPGGWLDILPVDLRLRVLDRWLSLPSAAGAVAYMEAGNGSAPGPYWRQLASYYAKTGKKADAVAIVAQAHGLSLGAPMTGGDFGAELAVLREQGNDVAVRRLLKDAVEAQKPDPENLKVALSWYTAGGDWEMAWRAASRLVTATKNRH